VDNDQPADHDINIGGRAHSTTDEELSNGGAGVAAYREDEWRIGIGIFPDKANTAIAVGMGDNQPQMQCGQIPQQHPPHNQPPGPARKQKVEDRRTDNQTPPRSERKARPVRAMVQEP
jgi:hypothetical protein